MYGIASLTIGGNARKILCCLTGFGCKRSAGTKYCILCQSNKVIFAGFYGKKPFLKYILTG